MPVYRFAASAVPALGLAALLVLPALGQERLDHLLQAAEHLERAGVPEKAAEIRTLADQELRAHGQRLLDQKLVQLETLQKEIERLRQAIAVTPQVRLQWTVYEYLPSELQKSGLGLVSLQQLLANPTPTTFVDDTGKLTEFIDFLQKHGLVRKLCCPACTTTEGQPATVSVQPGHGARNAEQPDAPPAADSPSAGGYSCSCTPRILEGRKLRLSIEFQQTRTPGEAPGIGGEGPAATSLAIATAMDLQSGQALLIGGAVARGREAEATGLLAILRADILPAGKTPEQTP